VSSAIDRPLGHDAIVARLAADAKSARASGAHRLSHALIFSGPAGVGKFRAALWWAARLKCADRECGQPLCRDCTQIAQGCHADVAVVEPDAENDAIYIETVRDLIHTMALRPLRPGPRIAIIRDAHRLTPQAQSAMLKLIEEPPGFAVLVLVTLNLSALLPTIRSRCQTIRFGPLSDDDVTRVIEAQGRPQEDARKAAALAAGSAGRALALTPEVIADRDDLIAAFEELRSGTRADVEALTLDLVERRKAGRPALESLLEWQLQRIEASLAVGSGDARSALPLGAAVQEDSQRLLEQASRTLWAIGALERNVNPRLAIRDVLLDVRPR
jgi:DNA polymerase-3 subunit delta'